MMKGYRSQKRKQVCTNLIVHDSCTSKKKCFRRHKLPIYVGLVSHDEESIQRCQEFLQSGMNIFLERDLQFQYSEPSGIYYYKALTPSIKTLIDLFINNGIITGNVITNKDFQFSQPWPISLLNVALDSNDKKDLMNSLSFFNFMNGGT